MLIRVRNNSLWITTFHGIFLGYAVENALLILLQLTEFNL
jgi:hypothetical protein